MRPNSRCNLSLRSVSSWFLPFVNHESQNLPLISASLAKREGVDKSLRTELNRFIYSLRRNKPLMRKEKIDCNHTSSSKKRRLSMMQFSVGKRQRGVYLYKYNHSNGRNATFAPTLQTLNFHFNSLPIVTIIMQRTDQFVNEHLYWGEARFVR